MIKGLKKYQAVICGDKLLVQLADDEHSWSRSNYVYQDGEETISVAVHQALIPKTDKLFSVKNLGKKLSHYARADGQTMSVEDYNNIEKENRKQYEDEDGDVFYPNLEVEFECRKKLEQLRGFKAEYVDLGEERTPVEITVIGSLEDTGSPFIETCFHLGVAQFDRYTSGVYRVKAAEVALDEFKKLEQKYRDRARFAHDDSREYVRFSKVDGSYVFGDNWPFLEGSVRITEQLDDAQKIEKSVRKMVRQVVIDKIQPVAVDKVTCRHILSEIKVTKGLVGNIDSKIRTGGFKTKAYDKLLEIEQLLLSYISEHVEGEE